MNIQTTFANWLTRIAHKLSTPLTVTVDKNNNGWTRSFNGSHRDTSQSEQLTDAIQAWRKNPIAKRIIDVANDYVIGGGITLTSHHAQLSQFITDFWNHPKNLMDFRLEPMLTELQLTGDLFPVLFTNKADGMSYLRFLTKEQITKIETEPNDWETETAYFANGNTYINAHAENASKETAVALHYRINALIGATYGESDIATAIPWLLRYNRLLEDRIRQHWASKMFLWFVKVPTDKVNAKSEQYRDTPEAGSVVVHDEGEEWTMQAPNLRGSSPQQELQAMGNMIDAASGQPPHWRGQALDINQSTAKTMQEPAERHLERRQAYFVYILEEIVYTAYLRAHETNPTKYPLPQDSKIPNYKTLFTVTKPDISRTDNSTLATAVSNMTSAYTQLVKDTRSTPSLTLAFLRIIFKFAGEPKGEDELAIITNELLDKGLSTPNEVAQ